MESGSLISGVDSHATGHTGDTADTGTSKDTGTSIVTGTNLPLVFVSAYHDEQQRHRVDTLPMLPSHRFRYSVWHDLSRTHVKGSQLKAPRIRRGPPEKEEFFYKVRDENNKKIHHSKKGKDRKDYQNKTEDWESAIIANLSYQELGHKYQMENFIRVLKRLIHAEEINLYYNGITDLDDVSFPSCKDLVLSENYLNSFKKLPRIPSIEELDLTANQIAEIDGLVNLCKSPIKSLTLKLNPISFTLNYRQRIFAELPGLQMLDGIAKLPEDEDWQDDQPKTSSCVIS